MDKTIDNPKYDRKDITNMLRNEISEHKLFSVKDFNFLNEQNFLLVYYADRPVFKFEINFSTETINYNSPDEFGREKFTTSGSPRVIIEGDEDIYFYFKHWIEGIYNNLGISSFFSKQSRHIVDNKSFYSERVPKSESKEVAKPNDISLLAKKLNLLEEEVNKLKEQQRVIDQERRQENPALPALTSADLKQIDETIKEEFKELKDDAKKMSPKKFWNQFTGFIFNFANQIIKEPELRHKLMEFIKNLFSS